MVKPLVAANWKMFKGPAEAREFFTSFLKGLEPEEHEHFVIFPSNLNLLLAAEFLSGTEIGWGAQNIYPAGEGAFTGENSPKALKEAGATYALVGHSERRTLFGETDELIGRKVAAAQQMGLTPMLCVGETLSERETDRTAEVVQNQLIRGLAGVDHRQPLVIAYEPVWAIGTGRVATPEQASEVHSQIRKWLSELGGAEYSARTPILYGGSVKPDNARAISRMKDIDGFLVGGASLVPESFTAIYRNCL